MGRARQEGRGGRGRASCAWAPQLGAPTVLYQWYSTQVWYWTISACTRAPARGMPATWPSIRLCWLSAALLAFSAALLAFSAAAFRGPPSPSFRQRRRVAADGFATGVTAGSPGTGVAVTAKPTAAPDLAQADLCKPGWHFNLHSGDGTFQRARMTGKKRRCDSVIMHAAHGGMAASYDSPT